MCIALHCSAVQCVYGGTKKEFVTGFSSLSTIAFFSSSVLFYLFPSPPDLLQYIFLPLIFSFSTYSIRQAFLDLAFSLFPLFVLLCYLFLLVSLWLFSSLICSGLSTYTASRGEAG